MPLCANDISPGIGLLPPPTSATAEMVWCGDLNGRLVMSPLKEDILPATELTLVVSMASCKVSGGRMEDKRLASMLLPEPGGPIMMTLWLPAAETSIALLMFSCPLTSLKSTAGSNIGTILP